MSTSQHPDWMTSRDLERHVGRSLVGTRLEDGCPCPKEPCGLVRLDDVNDACDQHAPDRAKTLRQVHPPERCPDERTAREAAGRRLYDQHYAGNEHVPHWHEVPPEDRATWVAASERATS